MKPNAAPSNHGERHDAESVVSLARSLVRTSLLEAVPMLTAQLAPLLAEALVRALNSLPGSGSSTTYVTVKQAATIMGCHPATVRRLVREGKLGRYLLENDIRIKVSDVHAYMARAGVTSPSIDLAERALEIMGLRGRNGDGSG